MTLNSNDLPSVGSTIPPMDVGTYPARTVGIVDLGMQARPAFQGKDKPPVTMMAITYEFVDEFLEDEDGNDIKDKPRWLTERFPLYPPSSEKAKSTLRYNALDPENKNRGDFSGLINTPCMVTVVHNPKPANKGGGVYENIGGVTAMREKDAKKCPPLVNTPLVFDLDSPDLETYGKLPKFIQDWIKGGLEYEGSKLYDALGEETVAPAPSSDGEKEALDAVLNEDDNPY